MKKSPIPDWNQFYDAAHTEVKKAFKKEVREFLDWFAKSMENLTDYRPKPKVLIKNLEYRGSPRSPIVTFTITRDKYPFQVKIWRGTIQVFNGKQLIADCKSRTMLLITIKQWYQAPVM